jgi:Ca2+-transporting ATPase
MRWTDVQMSFGEAVQFCKYMAVSGVHEDRSSSITINGTPREMYYIKGSIDTIFAAASKGLRVIALAYGDESVDSPSTTASSRQSSRAPSPEGHEKTNLVFVGFQAMLDPPRRGVADSIGLLQAGGVHVVMITGYAEQTALSIAQKLRLRVGRSGGGGEVTSQFCLTGSAIDQMTKAQLKERVGSVSVFARTTPRHKMAIVEAPGEGRDRRHDWRWR